ncbi:hypothetical protein L7F22_034563 [Adiantum nelumboides]|nr:hypothetical protein [Adiantum nelumboides]MCO5580693.1 hypothetical protein [Adiantum nelumboides]
MEDTLWTSLPDHLQEKVLTFLSTIELLRGRLVCKRWLALISSSPDLLRSRAPWLLLYSKTTSASFACDVEERKWYKLPAFVLPARAQVLHGCVQGLLIAEGRKRTCCVGDPWTGQWTSLQLSQPFSRLCGFHFHEDTNACTILALGWSNVNSAYREVTRVFHPLADPSPSPLTLSCNPDRFMVERGGALFSWDSPRGLVIFDKGKDVCLHEENDTHNRLKENNSTLLHCGDTLVKVFVTTLGDDDLHWCYNKEIRVVIHQWHPSNPPQEPILWQEVGVMPPTLLAELLQSHSKINLEFTSAGPCHVCFRARMGLRILSFNLNNKVWDWLPDCPSISSLVPKSEYHHLRGFGLKVWPQVFSRIVIQVCDREYDGDGNN